MAKPMQRANEGGSDAEKQSAEDKPEGRWLVVTTDSVVSFFDYLVPQSIALTQIMLNSRSFGGL
jgi:hypothetical protein